VTLDFVIPEGSRAFMDLFAQHVTNQGLLAGPGVTVRVRRFAGIDPVALAATLERAAEESDGIGVVPVDHPLVREAIRAVAARGVKVLTLMSDLSGLPTVGYIGIDNRAAGRLAGYLLGRLMPPGRTEVALFTGSLSYRGHEEREMGFRSLIAEEFPRLSVVEFREVGDDSARAFAETRALLATRPDLGGIYNIGGGLRGIADALEEAGRALEVVFVGHELTEAIRRYLLRGTVDAVIDQNPRVEAREAIERLRRAALGQDVRDWIGVRTQVIFRENVPDN
jgi:LacI family transcriptional regulator